MVVSVDCRERIDSRPRHFATPRPDELWPTVGAVLCAFYDEILLIRQVTLGHSVGYAFLQRSRACRVSLLIVSAAYRSSSSEAATKSVAWQPLQVAGGPGSVVGAGMVYDRKLKEMIFWGGGNTTTLGATWSYTASGWTRLVDGAVRIRAGVAYDSRVGKLIAFGGISSTGPPLGDTWSFDGATWQEISTSGPPARESAVMAYFPRRKELVLFGGGADTSIP